MTAPAGYREFIEPVPEGVKVCAVDEAWSGIKLVIRRELRTNRGAT